MYGTIPTLLKRYLERQYDHNTRMKPLEYSGLGPVEFEQKTVYPDELIYALVGQAAEMTGRLAGERQGKFGEYLVPDLMCMYQKLLRFDRKILAVAWGQK